MNDPVKKKFKEIEKLSSKIDMILESISFWEVRMEECFVECDEIEENQWEAICKLEKRKILQVVRGGPGRLPKVRIILPKKKLN